MRRIILSIAALLLFAFPSFSTTYTVKSGGGGNYTTISACTAAMSAGDTCTVYAGTYSESVTVSAGTVGNYKTINVNGSDVVTVTGSFTLNSYTRLSGITFNHTGSCISLNSSAAGIHRPQQLPDLLWNHHYQFRTYCHCKAKPLAYAGCVPPNPSATCGRWFNISGSHILTCVE